MALPKLFCISANSRWTDLVDREKLSLSATLMGPFLKSLSKSPDTGFYYLSTCHRVEVYGFGADPTQVIQSWCEATDARPEGLRSWRGEAALEHFARVAAGMESEIVGENQIMGQVRSALREAKESGILCSPLGHILQRGLRIARNIRNESRIGEGRENLSDLALSSLAEVFESLEERSFLVVGAGTMSLLALERLKKFKTAKITWINRSRDKIEGHPYARFCKIEDYAKLYELVHEHDVAFLATSAQHPILSKEKLEQFLPKKRKQNLKVILDLGLPRNAHPNVCDLGFIVRNVDDFKGLLDDQDALQRERIEFAEKILRRDLEDVKRDFDLESIGPLKREFIEKWKWAADEIVLEKSSESVYNRERFWAKLGHVLMTKANELGPYEGGQFLRYLCESMDDLHCKINSEITNAFEGREGMTGLTNFKVLPLEKQAEKQATSSPDHRHENSTVRNKSVKNATKSST